MSRVKKEFAPIKGIMGAMFFVAAGVSDYQKYGLEFGEYVSKRAETVTVPLREAVTFIESQPLTEAQAVTLSSVLFGPK